MPTIEVPLFRKLGRKPEEVKRFPQFTLTEAQWKTVYGDTRPYDPEHKVFADPYKPEELVDPQMVVLKTVFDETGRCISVNLILDDRYHPHPK